MKPSHLLFSVLIILSMSVSDVHGQCNIPSPPTTPACGAIGQILLTNNATVYSGTTYYYNGTGTLSNITNYGGTILVCGTLTMTYPNLSSGTVVVESGGSLIISDISGTGSANAIQTTLVNYGNLIIKGSSTYTNITVSAGVFNYGTLNVTSSLTVNSGGTYSGLYNANFTSSLTVAGDLVTNVPVVDNGTEAVNGRFTFNGGSTVCLGGGANLSVDSLFDDAGNNDVTVNASSNGTTAAISVMNNFTSNTNTLTATSNLTLCEAPGENNNPGGNPGSATVKTNCTNMALPVVLLSFSAETGYNNTCSVEWSIARAMGINDFVVEYSLNAIDFVTLGTVSVQEEMNNYTYNTSLQAKTWFRLRIENADGTYSYSAVVEADYQGVENSIGSYMKIQPNLITNSTLMVWINVVEAGSGSFTVVDAMGRPVYHQEAQLEAGITTKTFELPALASGIYRLLFLGSRLKLSPVPFSVIR